MGVSDLVEKEPARVRKVPARLESGSRETYHTDSSMKEKLKREYFAALDASIVTISDRFSQGSINIYSLLASLLRDAINGEDVVINDQITELYAEDFDFGQLKVQLSLVNTLLSGIQISTVGEFARWLKDSASRPYLVQVEKLVHLLLTLPATNATSERSFSALKRIKTFLRNSMGQQRLNSCMLLHIYKELNDKINVNSIIGDFVAGHVDRKKKIAVE